MIQSICLILCGLFATLTFSAASDAAEPDRPNVLFIAIDDLKPTIGAYGDELAITPNLDRLAARGTIFTNAHCQQAVCGPSRASLLLGLRPDTTKVWDLQTEFRDTLPDAVTLPQRFVQAGYATVGMGKIYHPNGGMFPEMDAPSWSEPYVFVDAPAEQTFGYRDPEIVAHIEALRQQDQFKGGPRKQLKIVFPAGRPPTDRADVPDEAYKDGAMAEVAKQRLQGFAESGESFFLAVGFHKPHLPFNAPGKYWDLYDRDAFALAEYRQDPEGAPGYATQPGWELRSGYNVQLPPAEDLQRELIHGYYTATSYVDAQVGKLLDTLDKTGLTNNTVIVLWGDHGFHLGDHDQWCKHTNYEQATRSPLIFVDPRMQDQPTRNDSPVELVDVYPTLLDLADLDPAPGVGLQGTSLRPILAGETEWIKDVAVSQYPRGGDDDAKMGYAYRDDRYRLVRWRDQNAKDKGETNGPVVAVELYDYEADPLEARNLSDDPQYADVLAEMQRKADAFRQGPRQQNPATGN